MKVGSDSIAVECVIHQPVRELVAEERRGPYLGVFEARDAAVAWLRQTSDAEAG